ncbi:VQ domain-containing protein [Heracleum sosnowskyi]|uniref:VQ domain-containing protein n=1 Tax=Heracleum sosnowskyi TaxID=360622 RepID=A0AAD8N962_9APIA|nr:VQ domain-containing protein [Heracleum sosnowskyi]
MESISEASLKLSMPRESRVSLKPKIRIIHVLEPTIIQTDVSNFREMVQRLTGKPKPASIERKRRLQDWDSDKKKMKKERKVLYCQSSYGNECYDGFLELDGLFEQEE